MLFTHMRSESCYYVAHECPLSTTTMKPQARHHILVVDRSGSMYGEMESIRNNLQAAHAYSPARFSVVSFSSAGDARIDVERSERPTDKTTEAIRRIQAGGLTCLSGALRLAPTLIDVRDDEHVTLTVVTDGYTNDPSPYAEQQAVEACIQTLVGLEQVKTINWIGFRDYCDWASLMRWAGKTNGQMLRAFPANSPNQHQTVAALLAGLDAVSRQEASAYQRRCLSGSYPNAAFLLAFDPHARAVRRLEENKPIREGEKVFAFNKQEKAPKRVKAQTGRHLFYVRAALITHLLQQGEIQEARALLFSSAHRALWEEYKNAASPSRVAAWRDAMLDYLLPEAAEAITFKKNVRPPFTLDEFIQALAPLGSTELEIDLPAFLSSYTRRSISRIAGTRNPDGSITPPNFLLRASGNPQVLGFTYNANDAAIQLKVVEHADLIDANTQLRVRFVAGADLKDLRRYRSYTIVGGAELRTPSLPLICRSAHALSVVSPFLTGKRPDVRKLKADGIRVEVDLRRMDLRADPVNIDDTLLRQAATAYVDGKIAEKIANAFWAKPKSDGYSDETLAELKRHHLTPALYFSGPTTTHYSNREEAIERGEIDSYTENKVFFGSRSVPTPSVLPSANAFIQKHYKIEGIAKPTLRDWLDHDCVSAGKTLKQSEVAFDAALHTFAAAYRAKTHETWLDEKAAALKQAAKTLTPACHQIAAWGRMNNQTAKTAEEVMAETPPKELREAYFYELDAGLVCVVVPTTKWFTVAPVKGAEDDDE